MVVYDDTDVETPPASTTKGSPAGMAAPRPTADWFPGEFKLETRTGDMLVAPRVLTRSRSESRSSTSSVASATGARPEPTPRRTVVAILEGRGPFGTDPTAGFAELVDREDFPAQRACPVNVSRSSSRQQRIGETCAAC